MTNHPNRSRRFDAELFAKLDADLSLLTAIDGIRRAYRAIPDEGHHKFQSALCQVIIDAGYPVIEGDEALEIAKSDDMQYRLYFGSHGGIVPLPIQLSHDMLLKLEKKLSREGTL